MSRDVYPALPRMAGALPDEHVVRRVLAGETELFELIMRRHNQRLYRVVRSITGPGGDAEDVLQDAYVRAYEKLSQFEGRARFATWLTRIAVHEAQARRRRELRQVPLDGLPHERRERLLSEASSERPGPEETALSRDARRKLERAIDSLPEHYRLVYVLRELEEQSTLETARQLGVSRLVVKTRLHRARALLRTKLGSQHDARSIAAFGFAGARCDRCVAGVLERLLTAVR